MLGWSHGGGGGGGGEADVHDAFTCHDAGDHIFFRCCENYQ